MTAQCDASVIQERRSSRWRRRRCSATTVNSPSPRFARQRHGDLALPHLAFQPHQGRRTKHACEHSSCLCCNPSFTLNNPEPLGWSEGWLQRNIRDNRRTGEIRHVSERLRQAAEAWLKRGGGTDRFHRICHRAVRIRREEEQCCLTALAPSQSLSASKRTAFYLSGLSVVPADVPMPG